MKGLKIVAIARPVSATSPSGSIINPGNAITSDPKEIATHSAAVGQQSLQIDYGAPQIFDTFFVGYNGYGGGEYITAIQVSNDPAFATGTLAYQGFVGDNSLSVTPVSANPRYRHGVIQTAPAVGRYVRFSFGDNPATAIPIGIVACGDSFTARWGHEYGSGRPLDDTSVVERLFGGGFGTDVGTVTSGYQWTFGDLSDSERAALFRIIAQVGKGRSLLVIEDPDFVYPATANPVNVAVTLNGRVIQKNAGVDGVYDAGVAGPVQLGPQGISFRVGSVQVGGAVIAGLSPTPAANSAATGFSYSANYDNANLYRTIGNVSTLVSTIALNDRIAVLYNEQRFTMLKNGNPVDSIVAAPDLALGFDLSFRKPGDFIAELNLFNPDNSERVHWGLVTKLDAYERADPTNTKWSLQIADWG